VDDPGHILLAPDARSAEAYLLAEITRLDDDARARATIPPPARIVVPSASLRQHLLARLAARRSAWLGIEVTTLRGLARTILVHAGEPPPVESDPLQLFLERAARRRRALARALGDFANGWMSLAAAASDLVNAGFEPALAPALLERIEAERSALPTSTLERARELVAALAEALDELAHRGLATGSETLPRAATLLARRGAELLPARALFVHGFADATGAAGDLLAALARYLDARVLLPAPADGDAGFGARLRERLEGAAGRARPLPAASAPAELAQIAEATPALEARALAAAALEAIGDGVRAEEIGIVLREPARARAALARELDRLGVPFSASAASGPLAPEGHRARALLALLERRGDLPADAALELLDGAPELPPAQRAATRLALRALGCARLDEAMSLDRGGLELHRERGYPLPVRAGVEDDDDAGARAPRRRLPLAVLLAALDRLGALLAAAESWPATAVWADHSRALDRLLAAAGDGAPAAILRNAAWSFADALPPDLELDAREMRQLLAGAWSEVARLPWGGAGGGVQILSVTEARGRTFGRLLLAGLVRGHFPRAVAEEALFPDALRLRLRELLPDLPVKREGHDEERFLFSQLLGAAPRVLLARATHDADGRPLPPSPLLEALARTREIPDAAIPRAAPAPALDRAVAAALVGGADAVGPQLAAALDEGRRRFHPAARFDPAAAAAARQRILVEYDTDTTTAAGLRRAFELGPYFGFGSPDAGDGALAATTLESHARCGWQAFLTRTLKLEALPEPLGALPGIDPLLLGSAVHDALARLFGPGDPAAPRRRLHELLDAPGRPLVWPDVRRVAEVARAAAGRALAEAGLAGSGLEQPLARRILERLEIARALDEETPPAELLGIEIDGEVVIAEAGGRPATIGFRADRLQREGERLVLLDFKTGRVPQPLALKTDVGRRQNLLAAVRSGERLQAALYALAPAPHAAEGRYVYVSPDDDPPARTLGLADDDDVAAAVHASVATLLAARRLALYPPRLLEPGLEREFRGCGRCAVAEACVRGDSGYRQRLELWHAREIARDAARGERDEALWRLWRLPAKPETER
jgi:hypothetical protein